MQCFTSVSAGTSKWKEKFLCGDVKIVIPEAQVHVLGFLASNFAKTKTSGRELAALDLN